MRKKRDVRRLTGLADTHELARFPDPLSPEAAARVAGLAPLDLRAAADYVATLAESGSLVSTRAEELRR